MALSKTACPGPPLSGLRQSDAAGLGAALLSGPCLSHQPGASVPGGLRWLKSHGMGLSAMGLTGGIRYVFGLYEAMERPLAVVTLV